MHPVPGHNPNERGHLIMRPPLTTLVFHRHVFAATTASAPWHAPAIREYENFVRAKRGIRRFYPLCRVLFEGYTMRWDTLTGVEVELAQVKEKSKKRREWC